MRRMLRLRMAHNPYALKLPSTDYIGNVTVQGHFVKSLPADSADSEIASYLLMCAIGHAITPADRVHLLQVSTKAWRSAVICM